ncbi:hypothetical protein BDZ89DRAFT_1149647 [Hymenopellis radicata]|nr:hypothetical protein BDZ89DRAFT_1149647 [Hymenopellis radicata]
MAPEPHVFGPQAAATSSTDVGASRRGRKHLNHGTIQAAASPIVHDHSLYYDNTGLVSSQPVPGMDLGDEVDDEREDEDPSAQTGKKRKIFPSDDPMLEWKPWIPLFLEETIRRHGLGDDLHRPKCSSRVKVLNVSDEMEGSEVPQGERAFRCRSCGDFMKCSTCCVLHHQRSPLHILQIWRTGSWDRKTLRELNLVYQVGHQGGPCPHPDASLRTMTLLHTTGVHTWQQLLRTGWYPATTRQLSTCATLEVLDLYRRLKTMATVNVRDFVSILESTTNPYETEWTPDRYKVFARIARQWGFLKRVRRAGVGHNLGGLATAKPGDLIVKCWACPRVGVNLPVGWDTVAEKYRYRYRRILSTDANFRMSNKLKAMAHPDPPLSYVTEEEVTNCAAFAALMQKDTWFTVGLRWSGVIGVICARHEIMLGLEDLQKGERYKNTAFVLYMVLSCMGLKECTITYDIACQYKKNFHAWIAALPETLRSLDIPELSWGLPVWHGNVHEPSCEASESVKYKVGAGKTDGEGPESRHDDIEDKCNLHNFLKNIRHGYSLLRRLKLALEERTIQVEGFKQVEVGVTAAQRRAWSKLILDWLEDPTKPSPYVPPKNKAATPSEAQIRLELRQQEERDARIDTSVNMEVDEMPAPANSGKQRAGQKAKEPKKGTMSETGFVISGLHLEESKQRLHCDRSVPNMTVER